MSGQGSRHRAFGPRLRVALGCSVLTALGMAPAPAQVLPDLLNPVPGQFTGVPAKPLDPARTSTIIGPQPAAEEPPAPSRIGQLPTYGVPAASGAATDGYDSLNRKRKAAKRPPGAPPLRGTVPPDPYASMKPAPALSPPPSMTAHSAPLAPSMLGTLEGQPYRRRLKVDDDPFGAVGDYVGSFLVKSAVEVGGGYDTNPGRFESPRGSAFYRIAPELLAASNWSRHSVVADLRGSFTGYGTTFPSPEGVYSPVPTSVDRPDFIGRIAGRLDVSRDTGVLGELRMRIGTDNPGSPNVPAGLREFPLYFTTGGSVGLEQNFNRLQVTVTGTADNTTYQNSKRTDGTVSTNEDRNFNQFGGIGRVSYEVMPGLKPFGEVEGDTRIHETSVDRYGYQRDSTGGYAKAGTTFELTRLLTGEVSIGYAMRSYRDPRLSPLTGLLTSASLVWAATPLTSVRLSADTSVDETTLPGVSGTLTRTYTVEVDHDFRRWLTAIGKFSYGTLDYQNGGRFDNLYAASADIIYKLNRNFWVKGTVRREWLESNIAGMSSASTVVMLGVRVQN